MRAGPPPDRAYSDGNTPFAIPGYADPISQLAQEIRELLESRSTDDHATAAVRRLSVAVPNVSLLDWLGDQATWPRVYWSPRGSDKRGESAGVGICNQLSGQAPRSLDDLFSTIRQRLFRADPNVRYFGGARFDTQRPIDPSWMHFGSYWFTLPRFELHRRIDGGVELACNLRPTRDRHHCRQILNDLAKLRFLEQSPEDSKLECVDRHDRPSRESWFSALAPILENLERDRIQKVVLARETTLSFSRQLNPFALLERLRRTSPACFHLCLQPAKDSPLLLCATPERLYLRDGRHFESEAIAGTRPRHTDAHVDQQLCNELTHDEKEDREHRFVSDGIYQAMAPLCTTLATEEAPSVLRLTNAQHLITRISGTLKHGVLDEEILGALHPTPAVGGVPRSDAFHAIRLAEPFDRGWYAGPIGWVGREASEFGVAIRSALTHQHTLRLFAGAGIVCGSDPDREWQEIENKIGSFVTAIATDDPSS